MLPLGGFELFFPVPRSGSGPQALWFRTPGALVPDPPRAPRGPKTGPTSNSGRSRIRVEVEFGPVFRGRFSGPRNRAPPRDGPGFRGPGERPPPRPGAPGDHPGMGPRPGGQKNPPLGKNNAKPPSQGNHLSLCYALKRGESPWVARPWTAGRRLGCSEESPGSTWGRALGPDWLWPCLPPQPPAGFSGRGCPPAREGFFELFSPGEGVLLKGPRGPLKGPRGPLKGPRGFPGSLLKGHPGPRKAGHPGPRIKGPRGTPGVELDLGFGLRPKSTPEFDFDLDPRNRLRPQKFDFDPPPKFDFDPQKFDFDPQNSTSTPPQKSTSTPLWKDPPGSF